VFVPHNRYRFNLDINLNVAILQANTFSMELHALKVECLKERFWRASGLAYEVSEVHLANQAVQNLFVDDGVDLLRAFEKVVETTEQFGGMYVCVAFQLLRPGILTEYILHFGTYRMGTLLFGGSQSFRRLLAHHWSQRRSDSEVINVIAESDSTSSMRENTNDCGGELVGDGSLSRKPQAYPQLDKQSPAHRRPMLTLLPQPTVDDHVNTDDDGGEQVGDSSNSTLIETLCIYCRGRLMPKLSSTNVKRVVNRTKMRNTLKIIRRFTMEQ
jgi:hypothetical protein